MSSRSARAPWSRFVRGSLVVRLSGLFALIALVAIAAVGLSLYFSLSAQLDAIERERLLGTAEQLRRLLADIPDRSHLIADEKRLADLLAGHAGLHVDVMDESGAAVLELSSFAWPTGIATRAAVASEGDVVTSTGGGRYQVMLAKARLGEERVLIGLAHDRAASQRLLSRLAIWILVACVLGSAMAGAFGSLAAAHALRPLAKMARAAKRIGPGRLGERLDPEQCPAELSEMAESFNQMLAGLEDSFVRLSQFSSDLAHELRTPIGNLMLHAQVALGRPRSEAELRTVLESGLEELERLSRMVNDMLFLAKADHAQIALKREPIDIGDEVDKVLEFFEPLASERSLRLVRTGEVRLNADRTMVRRLLANLVSNAVRHGAEGSTVTVSLHLAGKAARIAVTNVGRPLSSEECRRVFDRFYRIPKARGGGAEGAGLGLSIVKSIVELHGGAVEVTSTGGRNTFCVTLGAQAEAASAAPRASPEKSSAWRRRYRPSADNRPHPSARRPARPLPG